MAALSQSAVIKEEHKKSGSTQDNSHFSSHAKKHSSTEGGYDPVKPTLVTHPSNQIHNTNGSTVQNEKTPSQLHSNKSKSHTQQNSQTHLKGMENPSVKVSYRNSAVSVKPTSSVRHHHHSSNYSSTAKIDDEEFEGEDYHINYDETLDYQKNSFKFQADASTMAQPIGYRPLELLPKKGKVKKDAETQVSPMEIEKTAAIIRGIILNPSNVLWPTNRDFSIMKAEKKIEDYVSRCWGMCPSWFFHVEFLQAIVGCYRNKYIFEVKWSLPTAENPIPIATASVYFVFDVETYAGKDEAVKVSYILEGTRYPHIPGEIPFQQKWISGIICEKIRLKKCA